MNLPPFEAAVTEHGPMVLRICRAMVGPDDADDVWSETFLAALIAYPRLEAESNLRGWLATISYRKAIDRIRARARAPLPVDRMPELPAAASEPATPDTELWRAIGALPRKQRHAVVYHYVADLPYAEVATLLDCNDVAARRAAADGIRALRSTVAKEDR